MDNEQKLDPRLHFVVATAIIVRDGKLFDDAQSRYLIVKRAPNEKVFPNKWSVPGGKLVLHEYSHLPKTAPTHPQWYNVVDFVLRKEVREEVGLEIERPKYVCDLVFIRPDGYPVVTLSYWAKYKSGGVVLNHELSDFAWVTLEEARGYDFIEGIWDEIRQAEEMLKVES